MMTTLQPFHLAIPVHELETARVFYRDVLNCSEGRSSEQWVDFDFYGHQLVIHCTGEKSKNAHNPVDEKSVPVPHFGVVLQQEDWNRLAKRLKAKHIEFIIEPYTRFKGEVGEQSTMFFLDPSGNALEFKAFKNPDQLFAS